MNAAFLLMSSAALAGADVAPPPPAATAPVVVHGTGGCTNCGTPAPVSSCGCEKKVGLFYKLKSKCGGFGKKPSHDCGCVPACAPAPMPLPTCHTCNTCPTSIASRPNLLDKMKGWCGHKKASHCGPVCDSCGVTATTGCATPGAPYVPPTTGGTTTTPPKEMPKETPKTTPPVVKPKGDAGVPLPLPPVSGASGTSPY